MRSNIYSIFSAIFLAIGFIFLFNSASTITGHAISEKVTPISSSIFSIYFFAGAIWFSYLANKRKGQAATEFLMTYGWAILALIAVIGALVYFGMFSNNQKNCNNILLSPPFIAQGSEYNNGVYSIEVSNAAPVDITVSKIDVGSCSANINRLVKYGDTIKLSSTCSNIPEGAILKIYYILQESSLTQTSQGDVCLVGYSPESQTTCGNGLIENPEQCDDGNPYGQDGCGEDCQIELGYACIWEPPSRCNWITCGDGLIQGSEACDDFNLITGDGCSNECQVESGYTCDGQPSVCTPARMYYLMTTINGMGNVFCNGVSCQEQYPELTTVLLTAEPPENFISWDGDCTIMQEGICSVTMDNDKEIIAEFSR